MVASLPIKLLTDTAILPKRGSELAAGYDLCADIPEKVVLEPGETRLICTGVAMAIPEGYFGGVYARSGIATREGLRPANCVGVIDADYRGEIKVPIYNDSKINRLIEPGEKIAQLIIQPFAAPVFTEVDDLGETARGIEGFGSTGKH